MTGRKDKPKRRSRPWATLILAVLVLAGALAAVALAAGLGHVVLVRAGLQAAADSAAVTAGEAMDLPESEMLQKARKSAARHRAGGMPVELNAIQYGTWHTATRTFTPSQRPGNAPGNAVRVTATTRRSTARQLSFYGGLWGRLSFASKASAVAAVRPRDIALVADLSGSMNDVPDHTMRRALIAAIYAIKQHNTAVEAPAERDWVSIVTFDSLLTGGPVVRQPLTADYDAAMHACADLQPADRKTRATEAGLIAAKEHIKPRSAGGKGRPQADKVVILLTGGVPNVYSSSRAEIDRFVASHPSEDFYNDGAYALNAPLMQAARMRADDWRVFAVGVGPGTDYDFLGRLARLTATAAPARHRKRRTEIVKGIIGSPRIRLVQ